MQDKTLQAVDLLKTTGIITCSPDTPLSESLSKLSRSHDACFVVNENKELLGVISPYFTIFKSKYPPDTKALHALFKPPKITLDTEIWDITKLMVESKTYFLPVVEHTKFLGIISINRLFRALLKDKDALLQLNLPIRKHLIVVLEKSTLQDAYGLMKESSVSRLPIVNNQGKLVGITTRFDIQQAFKTPQSKMRWLSRSGEKESNLSKSLSLYSKKFVYTLPQTASPEKIISLLLTKNVGSVVIVDKSFHPTSIVSGYDILVAISNLKPLKDGVIELHADTDFVYSVQLEQMLSKFAGKAKRIYHLEKLIAKMKTRKNAAGIVNRFECTLQIHTSSNRLLTAKTDSYNWKESVTQAIKKIEQQLRD